MRTLEDEQLNAITYYNSNQNNKQIFMLAISLKSEKYPTVSLFFLIADSNYLP